LIACICFILVCGACKTGTLHPLFTVRTRKSPSKPTTAANGRQAATLPRGALFVSYISSILSLGGCFFFAFCRVVRLCFAERGLLRFVRVIAPSPPLINMSDSPRLATVPLGPVNVFTGMRMPGSFNFGDDGAELDALVVGIRGLEVEEADGV